MTNTMVLVLRSYLTKLSETILFVYCCMSVPHPTLFFPLYTVSLQSMIKAFDLRYKAAVYFKSGEYNTVNPLYKTISIQCVNMFNN